MKITILILSLMICGPVIAAKEKHHHELGAHVHGAGTLAIAFDDSKGKINFKAAAEGILGWEHKARSEKDKKTLADAVARFENEIGSFVHFDPALNCQFTKELIGQVPEAGEEQSGEHSDWASNYTVVCAKSPIGTTVSIDFSSFKLLKDVNVTVLIGAVQKSAEFKKIPLKIELN